MEILKIKTANDFLEAAEDLFANKDVTAFLAVLTDPLWKTCTAISAAVYSTQATNSINAARLERLLVWEHYKIVGFVVFTPDGEGTLTGEALALPHSDQERADAMVTDALEIMGTGVNN